jgi:Flp pilus assembly protein TadB
MIIALIAITGILAGLLIAMLWIDLPTWLLPAGKGAAALKAAEQPATKELKGVQRWVAPLDKPVARWTPAGMMRSLESDLYWNHFIGEYTNWTAGQFMSLRVAATLATLGFTLLLLGDLMLAAVFTAAVWFVLPMNIHSDAEDVRKRIRAQMPEFVQLIAASMAAGVSLEEALNRASRVENLSGKWIRKQVEASAGRLLIQQLQRAAQESRLTELITFAVQLEFVSRGSNQQDLMLMLSTSMAQDYVAHANERASAISNTLSLQTGIFFFFPFIVFVLVLLVGPMLVSL